MSFIIDSLSWSLVIQFMFAGPFLMHHFLFCSRSPTSQTMWFIRWDVQSNSLWCNFFHRSIKRAFAKLYRLINIQFMASRKAKISLAEPILCDKKRVRVNQKKKLFQKVFFFPRTRRETRLMTFWLNKDFYQHKHTHIFQIMSLRL